MRVLEYLYTLRDLRLTHFFIATSELGTLFTIGGLTLCIVLFFLLRRKYSYVAGLVVSVAGSAGIAFIIKELVHRSRPDVIFRAYSESSFAFPSGHATLAAAFYGFLIYLVWRLMPTGYRRTVIIFALGLLVALISFSRLYLGIHYLSDVIAGLLLGGFFAWIGSAVVKKLERRN